MTSLIIGRMIRRMCRRLLAVLLILGWVSLSGFDVIEDLDEAPGQTAISTAPDDEGSNAKRGGWGPLANNIVESANRNQDTDVVLIKIAETDFDNEPVFQFQKHFQLHKLYHVFLI
ncbi:MAG TPA: hypothetical protein VIE90_15825 [Candidatus Binatia bacterium]